jgi:hypothetical protein
MAASCIKKSLLAVLLGSAILSNVSARKTRLSQQQQQQRYIEKDEQPSSSHIVVTPSSLEDEFGRWNYEAVQDFGRQRVHQNKPSRLRRTSQQKNNVNDNNNNNNNRSTPSRHLLTQRWEAVSTSFQESTRHFDGLQQSPLGTHAGPVFGERDSMNGINQHVRTQQLEAMFALEELQALMSNSMSMMSMTAPSGVRCVAMRRVHEE